MIGSVGERRVEESRRKLPVAAPTADPATRLFVAARLSQKVEQLPLLWRRKEAIRPTFRAYTADLLYDLQVYRALFDEVDRQLVAEPDPVRRQVQALVLDSEYPRFAEFLDGKLAELGREVAGYSRPDHEQHGFFFRRQLWDVILASEIMARTNLKPRGYAGDSVMMQMLYDAEPRGATIFAKMMHKHPIGRPAANAVRNRRDLVAARLQGLRDALGRDAHRPARVLSIACGPAAEIGVMLRACRAPDAFELVLLDQDPVALDEARRGVAAVEAELGAHVAAHYVRGSVRTLQQATGLFAATGGFDLIYSMGLFDYLTPPVAREVLRGLFQLAAPGGSLLIGNFHPRNPDRIYMEYWLDWVLFYRDDEELMDLASPLGAAHAEAFFEATGVQGFLLIRK